MNQAILDYIIGGLMGCVIATISWRYYAKKNHDESTLQRLDRTYSIMYTFICTIIIFVLALNTHAESYGLYTAQTHLTRKYKDLPLSMTIWKDDEAQSYLILEMQKKIIELEKKIDELQNKKYNGN